jgi:hypothetical protein
MIATSCPTRPLSKKYNLLLLLAFFSLSPAMNATAATKMLLLNPARAIFTDRTRSVEVHVGNIAKEPISYAVDVVTMRKDKNGDLREVSSESPEEAAVRNMIRFSPRRATIEPGKRQVVKLMVRKPADLAPGEYQTRLRFTPLPSEQAVAAATPAATEKATVDLNLLVTSTIPIIIQNGDVRSELTPVSLTLKELPGAKTTLAADVAFARSGSASAFGNVTLQFIPAGATKTARTIGQAQGLAVYLPDKERTLTVPLTGVTRQELGAGTIRVTFQPSAGVLDQRGTTAQERSKDFPAR